MLFLTAFNNTQDMTDEKKMNEAYNRALLNQHFGDKILSRLPFTSLNFFESSNSWDSQLEFTVDLQSGRTTISTIDQHIDDYKISDELLQRIESEIFMMLENI